jgi:RHS repeat-associated protein
MKSRVRLWRWVASVISVSILLLGSTARSQVAPIGAHHTSVGGGAGQLSPVSPTGGYNATVPISLPSPRGGLSLPFELRYTGTGKAGAAGIGWDVPLWYVRRSASKWHRKPALASDLVGEDVFPERVFLSMGDSTQRMVRGPDDGLYLPFAADEYMELREEGATFTLSTARGVDYVFNHAGIADPSLWLLTEVRDRVGTERIVLRYNGLLLSGMSYTYVGNTPLYDVTLQYGSWASPQVFGTIWSGDVEVTRSSMLTQVIVQARNNLDAGSSLRTIRTYHLDYAPDEDTTAPRLVTVDVSGDEDPIVEKLPVARYEYGSISIRKVEGLGDPGDPYNENYVGFGAPVVVPRDAAALAAGATRVAGSWGYKPDDDDGLRKDEVWSKYTIRDFTGDGVADLVYRDGGTWHLVKGVVTDAGFSLDGGPATSWTQPSEIHFQRILYWEDSAAIGNEDQRADMITTETLATFVDVNGDGRLDVIDARTGNPSIWEVWLNREGTDGLPVWEARDYYVDHLVAYLELKGIDLDAYFDTHWTPIERTRSWQAKEMRVCETYDPDGFPCVSAPGYERKGEVDTIAEWALTDVNADSFPDLVANTVPVRECDDEDGPWGGYTAGGYEYAQYEREEYLSMGSCTLLGELPTPGNELAVFLNPMGALVGGYVSDRPPSESPETWDADPDYGVMRWSNGDGEGGPYVEGFTPVPPWRTSGFRDVHGTGRPKHFRDDDVEDGYERFEDDRHHSCGSGGDQQVTSKQTRGLVDLNGDGVPDLVYREGTKWRVRFGTTASFGPPREILSELEFALSESSGNCTGAMSTKAGLIDLDGDGKPELVREEGDGAVLRAAKILTTDGVVGGVHAGRLVAIDNGYGARTEIRYANNKAEENTPHQVPAPEIVVAETQVIVTDGSAVDNVTTRYAYGTADSRYDPGADRRVFTGYRRMVTLVGGSTERTGADLIEGHATLVDRRAPSAWEAGYAELVLGGRVEEIHWLEGIFGPDPRNLLWLEAPYPQVRAHESFSYEVTELDVAEWTAGDLGRAECVDIREDGAQGLDLLCHHAGVIGPAAIFEWEGLEAPSQGQRNVARASAVTEVDERGRPLEIVEYGDMRTFDDDRCITIHYASGAASPVSVIASIRTTDCGWINKTLSGLGGTWVPGEPERIAGQRFLYDDLPQDSVSRGRLTSRIVENYDTSDGSFLGEHVAVTLTYDALGNVDQAVAARELGTFATRTTSFAYDDFGTSLLSTTESATDVALVFTQFIETSSWPSEPIVETNLNGVSTTTFRDHFGRPVRVQVSAPGLDHVVSEIEYAPGGLEVTGTTYPAGAGEAQRVHTHLDALGRVRFRQVELGTDYDSSTLVTDLVEFDSFGRPVYAAAPFEWAELPFSPDDLPENPVSWPFGVTTVVDSSGLWARTVEAPGKRPELAATDVAADVFVGRVDQTWEGGRSITQVRGPSENSIGEASSGARDDTIATAIGWPVESARFDGSGTRIDLVRRGFDRFGNEAVVERYKQPASAGTPVTWERHYDSLGRLVQLIEPGTAPITNVYDEWSGLLESSWIATGGIEKVSRFAYDGLGRQTLAEVVSIASGVETIESRELSHFDMLSGSPWQPSSDVRGRLSWIETRGVGAVYFGYDAVGRTSTESHFMDAYGQLMRTSQTFEPGGALHELRFDTPAGIDRIEYGRDSAMRTTSIREIGTGVSLFEATQLDAETGYEEILLGNGVREVFGYEPAGRRELLHWGVTTITGQRDQFFMARDAEGRSRQENVNHFGSSYFVQHEYDALDRVVRSYSSGATLPQDERFEYDPLGNFTRKRNLLQSNQNRDYHYYDWTDPDRLCRFGLPGSGSSCNSTYDAAGNLISDGWGTWGGSGNRLFSYDAASRVRQIIRGSWRATFQYGAGGALAVTEVWNGSTLNRRIRNFGGLIEERRRPDNFTQIERRVPGPLGIVATLRTQGANRETVYVHGDGRGNRFFTGSDGRIKQELRYRAFGSTVQDNGTSTAIHYSDDLWNGGDDLRELGVVVLGARVFDPVVGRFLQRDPIAISRSSSKANPYSFGFNDPVNYADPTGLDGAPITCNGGIGDECKGMAQFEFSMSAGLGGLPVGDAFVGAGLSQDLAGMLLLPDREDFWDHCYSEACSGLAMPGGSTEPVFELGPRFRGFLRCAGGTAGAVGCTGGAAPTGGAALACTVFMADQAAAGCMSMITGRDEDSALVTVLAPVAERLGVTRDSLRQVEALVATAIALGQWHRAATAPLAVVDDIVVQAAAKTHGNSKTSTGAQHVYEITYANEQGVIGAWKWGISGGKETAAGLSVRAQTQVRALASAFPQYSFASKIMVRVAPGPGARLQALAIEEMLAEEFFAQFGRLPPGMVRPTGIGP